jgi:hypothetical protein
MADLGKGMKDRARRLTANEHSTGLTAAAIDTGEPEGQRPQRSKFKHGGKIAMGKTAAKRLDQYARGGSVKKAKGKTTINIIIGDKPQTAPPPVPMAPPPVDAAALMQAQAAATQPGPGMGPPPLGPGAVPGGPPVGPMNRGGSVGFKKGGCVKAKRAFGGRVEEKVQGSSPKVKSSTKPNGRKGLNTGGRVGYAAGGFGGQLQPTYAPPAAAPSGGFGPPAMTPPIPPEDYSNLGRWLPYLMRNGGMLARNGARFLGAPIVQALNPIANATPADTGESNVPYIMAQDAAETARHSGRRGDPPVQYQPPHPPSTFRGDPTPRPRPQMRPPMPPPRPADVDSGPSWLQRFVSGQYTAPQIDQQRVTPGLSGGYRGFASGGRVGYAFGGGMAANAGGGSSFGAMSSNGVGNTMGNLPQMNMPGQGMPQGMGPGMGPGMGMPQAPQGMPGMMPNIAGQYQMSNPGMAATPNGQGQGVPSQAQMFLRSLGARNNGMMGQARQSWMQGHPGMGHPGMGQPDGSAAAPGGFKRGGSVMTAGGRSGLGRLQKARAQKKDC